MEQYLIDTNVISDYFSASLSIAGLDFMDSVMDSVPILSIITEIELLCWKAKPEAELKIKEFVSDSLVLELSHEIVLKCVEIRRNMHIKIPDAIIAASALAHDLILITNNERDFRNIVGLKILNPYKI
jgi:predicted nucleic acid-binding protein